MGISTQTAVPGLSAKEALESVSIRGDMDSGPSSLGRRAEACSPALVLSSLPREDYTFLTLLINSVEFGFCKDLQFRSGRSSLWALRSKILANIH